MKPGIFIKSTSALDDTVFQNTLIYITEYNDNGATGFVVNQPFSRSLNELEEFKHLPPFPIHVGGPVDQEHLFFIHRRPDIIPGGTPVAGDVCYGGDFKIAVQQALRTSDMKVFLGYCGWDKAELDAEMEEGSWVVVDDMTLF